MHSAAMPSMSRRDALRTLGLSIAVVPLASACGSSSSNLVDAPAVDDASADASFPGDWASGGTAAMTDKASYPDPFTAALSTCAIVASTTEGPCTTATNLARTDVSEGKPGLPVRLALKVVDTACAPIANAVVKIWHTDLTGSYSGVTPNPQMCLKDQAYASVDFMRGVQTTAADGTVAFDTCFPGWYRGRAIHIHFQVSSGGTTYRVSQLFFPEALTAAIFTSHVDYKSYGQPDTTFSNDNVIAPIPVAARDRHLLDIARMTDKAMLASKVVTVV